MKYLKPTYIYPPRPNLFHQDDIPFFSDNGYIAQLKLDDTRNLIIVGPDCLEMRTRHDTKHIAYSKPHPELAEQIMSLKLDYSKYHVFDSLLLHSKNALVKDTVSLIDILVYDSEYLYGETFGNRTKLLSEVCNNPKKLENISKLGLGLKVFNKVWLAKNYTSGFQKLWEKWGKTFTEGQKIVEGLVFKKIEGKLDYHFSSDKCSWSGKIRYAKKNYSF